MPSETPAPQQRYCGKCGAPVAGGPFCGTCGARLPVEPHPPASTGPPPPTTPPSPATPPPPATIPVPPVVQAHLPSPPRPARTRVVALAAAVAAAASAVVVLAVRGGGDDGASGPTTVATSTVTIAATTTTASPSTTTPATAPSTAASTTSLTPASPPTTMAPPTTAPPVEPGAHYIGLVYDPALMPAGITQLDGALTASGGYVVAWVSGPEGSMFWLQQVTRETERIEEVRVTDVVVFPPLEQDVGDIVVTATVPCELDGAPLQGVVGIFPNRGQQWLVAPYAVWWVDERSGTFVELPDRTTCLDEGYGA